MTCRHNPQTCNLLGIAVRKCTESSPPRLLIVVGSTTRSSDVHTGEDCVKGHPEEPTRAVRLWPLYHYAWPGSLDSFSAGRVCARIGGKCWCLCFWQVVREGRHLGLQAVSILVDCKHAFAMSRAIRACIGFASGSRLTKFGFRLQLPGEPAEPHHLDQD
jgi:hypothetical protein